MVRLLRVPLRFGSRPTARLAAASQNHSIGALIGAMEKAMSLTENEYGDGDKQYGEGNNKASRKYNQATKKFFESGRV